MCFHGLMKLATLRRTTDTVAVLVHEDGTLSELEGFADVGAWLATGAEDRERALSAAGPRREAAHPGELAQPVLAPRKIFCIGLNYRSHIEETGLQTPQYPTVFTKFALSLTGPDDSVQVPTEDHRLDYEGELCVVIGDAGRRLVGAEARAAIGGYAVSNDVSMRGWQGRTDEWTQGKAWEASTPVGPWVVTPDEFVEGAQLRTLVNGEQVQSAPTSDLVFDPVALVEYLSAMITLEPGDLILTGTPSGVALGRRNEAGRHPWLTPGDVVEVSIDGLGTQRTHVV